MRANEESLKINGKTKWISYLSIASHAGISDSGNRFEEKSTFVFFALLPAKTGKALALLLAGIAPATAPAASADVVRESRAQGRFANTQRGIVALDDAWGLVLFSICLAATGALLGVGQIHEMGVAIIHEIGGALLLGVAVGL